MCIIFKAVISNWTKCLKNQPCDVIKMKEMRVEVGSWKEKRWITTHFYDVIWLIFKIQCLVTSNKCKLTRNLVWIEMEYHPATEESIQCEVWNQAPKN